MNFNAVGLVAAVGVLVSIRAVQAQSDAVTPLPMGPRVILGAGVGDRGPIITVYGAVYDECASTPFAIGGTSYVMEDVSLEPGPWGNGYSGSRDVLRVSDMFQTGGWTGVTECRITHRFEFYEPGNFTTSPMLGSTTPIAVRDVPTNFAVGGAWSYTSEQFSQPVSLGTRLNVWVAIKAIDPLTGFRIPDGSPGLVQPVGQTNVTYAKWFGRDWPPCVGSTTGYYAAERTPSSPSGSATDFEATDRRGTAAGGPIPPRVLSIGLHGCVTPGCDPIDFNNDSLFPDTLDIADFLAVFGGGTCSNEPNCGDLDYNNDGLFPDTLDIDALLSVFSGGPCLR